MPALLIFPTVFEASAFFKMAGSRPALGAVAEVSSHGKRVFGMVSGCGCAASLERVRGTAGSLGPDFAVLCGFCGACLPGIPAGALIFESANADLAGALESAGASPGRIACSDSVAGPAEKAAFARAGYSAVDMESSLFGPVFGEGRFASFRAVSDVADSDVPAEFFAATMDPETGGARFPAATLAKMFLKNPGLPFRLARFASAAAAAKRVYDAAIPRLAEKTAQISLQWKA